VIARIRSFQSAARVSINGQDFTTGETELTPPARTFAADASATAFWASRIMQSADKKFP
jgi:hypothetical protein